MPDESFFAYEAEPEFRLGSLLEYTRMGLDAKAFVGYPLLIEKHRELARPPGGLPIAAEAAQLAVEIILDAATSYRGYVPRLR
jgi:hypothetical protein